MGSVEQRSADAYVFASLAEVRVETESWLIMYNTDRPSRACWPLTPAEFGVPFPLRHCDCLTKTGEIAGGPSEPVLFDPLLGR